MLTGRRGDVIYYIVIEIYALLVCLIKCTLDPGHTHHAIKPLMPSNIYRSEFVSIVTCEVAMKKYFQS